MSIISFIKSTFITNAKNKAGAASLGKAKGNVSQYLKGDADKAKDKEVLDEIKAWLLQEVRSEFNALRADIKLVQSDYLSFQDSMDRINRVEERVLPAVNTAVARVDHLESKILPLLDEMAARLRIS